MLAEKVLRALEIVPMLKSVRQLSYAWRADMKEVFLIYVRMDETLLSNKKELLIDTTTWMDLKGIVLSIKKHPQRSHTV